MPDHDCSVTTSSLLNYLENGTPLSADVEEELRKCPSCSEVLQRAQRLAEVLETNPTVIAGTPDRFTETLASSAASEVVRRRRKRLFWSALLVLLASVAFGTYTAMRMPLHHPVAVAFLISFIVGGPMLLLMVALRSVGSGKVFKRLKGRQISGVCRGLSIACNVPVWFLRAIFVVLLFAKGAGLLIYLLLDLVLPIYPEDRKHLLRFRVLRWWKARLA